jgi:creatinine amidohydrolase
MKPPTVFLGEMTNPELEAFLREHQTVIVPVGSTEQHGPHGPLASDVLIPAEIARRIAPHVGAVVAPAVSYGLSYPHTGFTGVVQLRIATFMALIEELALQFAGLGFRRICFLNGHYDNTYAIAYACAAAGDRLPAGARAFPVNYWDAMSAEEAAEFFDPANGLHANKGETSAVMAINPDLVDLERANAEMPPFPAVTNPAAVHTAFFFSSPGSVYRATRSGTWGDARDSSADFGERYLQTVARSTSRLIDDIERTFAAMPDRD